ncbi:MAG: 50S ribosomal protein L19 [Caldiserica bacterium]|nr:MAG: 50S ribosomal protein L19 [Caldisericota bacterium]
MDILKKLEEKYVKKDIPELKIGDTVRVDYKVREQDTERVQSFEGILIAKRGRGTGKTITLRKISFGVGVEKIFPLYSPLIVGIKVLKRAKVRRAKLYYLREKKGKEAKLKEIKLG